MCAAMKSICSNIILRSLLTFALMLQSVMPATLAIASEAGFDVSDYLCNPSQTAPTAQAQTHIKDLMVLLGDRSDDEPISAQGEHCSNCIISLNALISAPQKYLETTVFVTQPAQYTYKFEGLSSFARGPPLGGRAPPVLS